MRLVHRSVSGPTLAAGIRGRGIDRRRHHLVSHSVLRAEGVAPLRPHRPVAVPAVVEDHLAAAPGTSGLQREVAGDVEPGRNYAPRHAARATALLLRHPVLQFLGPTTTTR